MLELTEKKIIDALPRVALGLQRYSWIQNTVLKCDVSKDKNFQTKYNGFYRVRRNSEWRNHYFELMQTAKSQEVTFSEALLIIQQKTKMLEASFVSKLVATLNPDKPVIDKFVLTNFGLSLPYPYEEAREAKTIKVYKELCEKYDELLQKPVVDIIFTKFAQQFPWATITDIKKVDLILWQIREE